MGRTRLFVTLNPTQGLFLHSLCLLVVTICCLSQYLWLQLKNPLFSLSDINPSLELSAGRTQQGEVLGCDLYISIS